MRLNVGVIGSAGIPANYGGFETLVENIVDLLRNDFQFHVYCSSKNYSQKMEVYKQAKLVYIPLRANGKTSILYDVISILHAVRKVDILLVLGVGGAFVFPLIRLFTTKRIVVNIDGLEWKRQKWNFFAKAYLRFQERIAIRFAHIVVADNEGIQQYVQRNFGKDSAQIAYGGDHVRRVPLRPATEAKYGIVSGSYCFAVCRIEPENNAHVILEAFASQPEIPLLFVGNWKNSAYGRGLLERYDSVPNITMMDPIYDLTKLDEFRSNCKYYIHGHSAGGTNPSLVEAMNLGLPIIAFDVNYNRFTTENKAIYFSNGKDLAVTLKRLYTGETDTLMMGFEMHQIALRKFSWQYVAERYKQILERRPNRLI